MWAPPHLTLALTLAYLENIPQPTQVTINYLIANTPRTHGSKLHKIHFICTTVIHTTSAIDHPWNPTPNQYEQTLRACVSECLKAELLDMTIWRILWILNASCTQGPRPNRNNHRPNRKRKIVETHHDIGEHPGAEQRVVISSPRKSLNNM